MKDNKQTEKTSKDYLEEIKSLTQGYNILRWAAFFVAATTLILVFSIYMPLWLSVLVGQICGSFVYGFVHQSCERQLDELTKEWSNKQKEESAAVYSETYNRINNALQSYTKEITKDDLDIAPKDDDDDGHIH